MSPYCRRPLWFGLGALLGFILIETHFFVRKKPELMRKIDIQEVDDTYCVVYNLTVAEDLK